MLSVVAALALGHAGTPQLASPAHRRNAVPHENRFFEAFRRPSENVGSAVADEDRALQPQHLPKDATQTLAAAGANMVHVAAAFGGGVPYPSQQKLVRSGDSGHGATTHTDLGSDGHGSGHSGDHGGGHSGGHGGSPNATAHGHGGNDDDDDSGGHGGHGGGGHSHVHSYYTILFVCVAGTLGVVVQGLLQLVPTVPYTPAMLVVGIVLALIEKNTRDVTQPVSQWTASFAAWEEIDGHLLLYVFLPPLIFSDALALRWHVFRAPARPPRSLSLSSTREPHGAHPPERRDRAVRSTRRERARAAAQQPYICSTAHTP